MFRETLLAVCPTSAVMEYAEAFFIASDDAGRAYDEGPSCRVVLDPTDVTRWRTALELAWRRNASFTLPKFTGLLTVRAVFVNSELTLDGRYAARSLRRDAPLDPTALALARAATRALLQRIVARCEKDWVTFANRCPSIAACNERDAAVGSARTVL